MIEYIQYTDFQYIKTDNALYPQTLNSFILNKEYSESTLIRMIDEGFGKMVAWVFNLAALLFDCYAENL